MVGKFVILKIGELIQTKIPQQFFYISLLENDEEISLVLLKRLWTVCAVSTKSIRPHPHNKTESLENASCCIQIVCCRVLENAF